MKDNKCTKCGGEMKEGIVIDRGHYGVAKQPVWASRIKSMLWGTLENKHEIVTSRCNKCDYLESYAK